VDGREAYPPESEAAAMHPKTTEKKKKNRQKKKKPKKNGRLSAKRKREDNNNNSGGPDYEAAVNQITEWMNDRLRLGSVPRTQDIIEYAAKKKVGLTKKQVSKVVNLHPAYHMNVHRQREKFNSRKDMIVLTNSPGVLHCDIGFFSVVREYETPKTYQYGFLVCKDVLTRYTYLELLKDRKTAVTLMRVFSRIFARHRRVHPDYPILKIQFDKEGGMKGPQMAAFLKSNYIHRHLFEHSRSKAKFAESAIKLVRETVTRLSRDDPTRRWWTMLDEVEDDLNSKEVIVQGHKTGYAPRDINAANVHDFTRRIQKKVPSYYFAQFQIPPQFVRFKFDVGDIVRPKTLLASSQVLGVKRSQENLERHRFRIEARKPFVTKDLNARPAYKCVHLEHGRTEVFAEQDIALSY